MKFHAIAALILIGTSFGADGGDSDPFAPPPVKMRDRSKDKGSAEFLSDELLKAFDEPRLDKGTGKGGPGVIRITVLRSFHSPLMFSWSPGSAGEESWLNVKRIKMRLGEEGERTFEGLDLNSRIKLRPAQAANLYVVLKDAKFSDLPQDCWRGDMLDGSSWIFETAAEDGSTLIFRRSPMGGESILDHSDITRERLMREMHLTAFALMIWTLSGVDERPY